jgi:hypothetical protein
LRINQEGLKIGSWHDSKSRKAATPADLAGEAALAARYSFRVVNPQGGRSAMPVIITDKLKNVTLPANQYYGVQHPKNQIVLHHTVSAVGVEGDLAHWRQSTDRIATAIIIAHDGTPFQCFASDCWAHHLGIKQTILKDHNFSDYASRNLLLNQRSIGVEIDSAGGLTYSNGRWVSAFGRILPKERVQEYPGGFRGFFGFEKYTEEQIKTLRELLLYWSNERYGDIPLDYREDMWGVSDGALAGKPGLYSHVSYRPDKSDCHPQPELIEMLKSL